MAGLPRRLSYQDTGLLNFDREQFPHNIGSVGIFEGSIPFERYKAHVEERLDFVPRYRQRVVRVPLDLTYPVWRNDPDLDLSYHVRSVPLPAPGDERQLADLAGEFFAMPLDRERPLWEILLVSGLSGGRTAQLAKVHHCMVDGVAGIALLAALLDSEPNPAPKQPPEAPAGGDMPADPASLFIDGIFDKLQGWIDTGEQLANAVVYPTSALKWGRSVAEALWAAKSHLATPAPPTPWSTRLRSPRRLVWQALPFEQAHDSAKALGGTINDFVLTILASGLGRYLEFHGWETDGLTLRVVVPVNVRAEDEEGQLGNRVSFMLAGLPVGRMTARQRFDAIHRELGHLKRHHQGTGMDDLMRVAARIPVPVQAMLGAHMTAPNLVTNLLCTNVAGPRQPFYCLGHKMVAHYPWVLLTWRMGLSVGVMTYDDALSFSFVGDANVLSDLERLAEFVTVDGYRELQDAANARQRRKRAQSVRPETAEPAAAGPNGSAAGNGRRQSLETRSASRVKKDGSNG